MIDPLSDETIGYHIFLEPKGSVESELKNVIRNLAHEFEGPIFSPHVTLLARIPDDDESIIIKQAQDFASQLSPIILTLGPLHQEQIYFRALYSRVNEQDVMTQYHALASKIYSIPPLEHYFAHLSLLYGNYAEERKAEAIRHTSIPIGLSFTAHTLHLYKTHGKTNAWYKVQEFTMGR